MVAGVTPSTASVHLQRLKALRLVKVLAQGKHRYYSLDRADVAAALEALNVLAGSPTRAFVPSHRHVCARRALATITSRARLVSRCSTDSLRSGG